MILRLPSSRRRSTQRCATAAVEMAAVAPLVALLLVGLLEVGRMVQINQILTNAAREGARNASTGTNNFASVQSTVTTYLTNAGLTSAQQTGLTVKLYDVTQGNSGPSFDPSTAAWCDQLQVTVTLPLSSVQLVSLNFLPSSTVISAQAVWYSNQDQPYPSASSIVPPSGS